MWINGPFPCGQYSDWMIFRDFGLRANLDENERVEADDGYAAGDPEFVKTRSGILHRNNDTRKRVVPSSRSFQNHRF